MRALVVAAALAALARPAAGDLLLNEVLYDPEGADEGAEFVELWNPDGAPLPLAGVSIEAGDGSSAGAWAVIWTGSTSDSAAPHAPFLIPGTALAGTMQNGPDAVRLLRDGAVLDLLGYGPVVAPPMFEGAPAPDAPSGQSLARLADGVDTNGNAADWAVESAPTPGRPNHPEVGLAFGSPPVTFAPAIPWPGESVVATLQVRSTGRRGLAAGEWSAALEPEGAPGFPLASAEGPELPADGSAGVPISFRAPAARGPCPLRALLRAAAAGTEPLDTARIEARVGPGPLVVSEFAFRSPVGEWVEVECIESIPDLGALGLADRSAAAVPIDRGAAPRPASAGALLLLAESPASLRAAYALPESLVLGLRGSWPSLNDEDGADGVADVVRLFGEGGSLWDAVPYASAYADRGGSVERLAPTLPSAAPGSWAESVDPKGGTPGRTNSLRAAPNSRGDRGAFLAAPARALLRRGSEVRRPLLLQLTEEARGRRLRIEVRDLRGRTRRVLASGQRFPGGAALLWDGRDDRGEPVPPGIYTVRAEADAEEALPSRATSLALWVAEEGAP